MKILAIGNSFSADATTYLYEISKSANFDMYVVNLFIGGCSLEMHANNLKTDAMEYEKFVNTGYIGEKVSIKDTLLSERWDVVTIQQVSVLSGLIDSYEPYAGELLKAIREYVPSAEIYFHQTWAYEVDSTHSGFANYEHSQDRMAKMIEDTGNEFAKKNTLKMIRSGDVIKAIRLTPEFNYKNGGISLCRDGFHMSFDYGRYAVGAVWFRTLSGCSIAASTFAPEGTDEEKIRVINSAVEAVVGNK